MWHKEEEFDKQDEGRCTRSDYLNQCDEKKQPPLKQVRIAETKEMDGIQCEGPAVVCFS